MDDDEDECKHGLDPRWCTVCKHGPSKDPRAQPIEERVIQRFTAGFAGACRECGFDIVPGQTILKLAPTDRYVHADCFK